MNKLLPFLAALLFTFALVATAHAATVPYSYEVIDLGPLIDTNHAYRAIDINNNGQVIVQGPANAFLCSNGTATNLGVKNVYGINNYGDIVGSASGTAFLYKNGTSIPFETGAIAARGINDSEQIVGYGNFIIDASGHTADRGFIADGNVIVNNKIPVGQIGTFIPTAPSGTSYAYSINSDGHFVGNASCLTPATNTAFLMDSTMTNLGTLGGATSTATSINDNGQIVGQAATASSGNHAFLYDNGSMTDLSNILFNNCRATTANDINIHGQVVGEAAGISGGVTAYLYDGSMTDLNSVVNTPSYTISSANAINDLGQIAATGKYMGSAYYTRALILTPAVRIWDGGGTGDDWGTQENWYPDQIPVKGSALTFSGTARQTIINNSTLLSVGLVTFANGGFNISGNPLILNAGIVSTGDNTWAINSTLFTSQTFTSLSGTLTISGSVNNNGNLLAIDGPGNHLISGAISGTGGLCKAGSGTLTLSSTANNYKGNTTIAGGILEFTGGINLDSTPLIDVENGKAVFKTTNVNNNALNIETGDSGIFEIVNGVHTVGNIEGTGSTIVNGQLTATSINQSIVTLAAGSRITIAPLPGGPMSDNTQLIPVPEPGTIILMLSCILLLFIFRRPRK
jgi:probable HAF family extracellular repeat protein/autotransporter-associated beta strand protein